MCVFNINAILNSGNSQQSRMVITSSVEQSIAAKTDYQEY